LTGLVWVRRNRPPDATGRAGWPGADAVGA